MRSFPLAQVLITFLNCVHLDWELKNTPVIIKVQMEGTYIPRQALENTLMRTQCALLLEFVIISSIGGLPVLLQTQCLPVRQNVLQFVKYV